MKTKTLSIKDIITIVLLSLINLIIFSLGSFLYLTPITILLMPVFYSLLQGVVFFVIGVKVKKKGALLIYCVIQGAVAFNLPYLIAYVLAGVVAELILWRAGYGNLKGLAAGYVIMQLLACMGSTIYPYAITLQATLSDMENMGDLDVNVGQAASLLSVGGSALLLLGVAISAALGALIGWRIMKKHLLNDKQAAGEAR